MKAHQSKSLSDFNLHLALGAHAGLFVGLALLTYTLWAFFWMKGQHVSDAMARTTLATGSAPSNRALTQRMPPSAKWRRTVSSRTAIEAMCDLPTPPSPLRTITCHRTSSARHQHVIKGSSEGHQGAIREPLGGHQRANRVSTEGHQRVIRGSSKSHRMSSERPQRVIRGSSESQSPTRTLTVASPLVIASTSLGYIPTRCTWRALSSAGAS